MRISDCSSDVCSSDLVVSSEPLATVKAALDQRFGAWTMPGTPGKKDFAATVPQSAPRIVLIDRPDSPQSLIRAGAQTGLKGTDDMLPYNTAHDTLGGNFLRSEERRVGKACDRTGRSRGPPYHYQNNQSQHTTSENDS